METPLIPDALADFIRAHVQTHEQLAVLVFLHGRAGAPCTVDDLAGKIAEPIAGIEAALAALSSSGLVRQVAVGVYAYRPATPALADMAAAIVDLHRHRLADLAQLLTAHAVERVR